MKHVRVTAALDPERAPAFFDRLANSAAVSEARVLDWNLAAEAAMLLFDVAGDPAPIERAATDLTGVERVEVSAPDGQRPHVLVHVERSTVPIFSCLAAALESGGLVVRTPIVFRDGEIHCQIVGDPGPLQDAFERRGDDIDVRIDEISSTPGASERPADALSDRQREALTVARELGYFEQPRGATHEDVAAALECAPQTASDHLQKAEAKLVEAVLDGFGREV